MGMIRVLLDDDSLVVIPYLDKASKGNNIIAFISEKYYMIDYYVLYYLVSYLLIRKFLIIGKEGADYEIQRIC